MSYTKRTLWIHLGLFLLVFLAFILPVVIGTAALLPLWLSGGLSIVLAAAALIDAAFKFFAPPPHAASSCSPASPASCC